MVIPPCWRYLLTLLLRLSSLVKTSGVESLFRTTGMAQSESSIGVRLHITKHFVRCGQQDQGNEQDLDITDNLQLPDWFSRGGGFITSTLASEKKGTCENAMQGRCRG